MSTDYDFNRNGSTRGNFGPYNLEHCTDLSNIPAYMLDVYTSVEPREGSVLETAQVFDVPYWISTFHCLKAIEDRGSDLRDARLEVLGQEHSSVNSPPLPTIG